LQRALGEWTTRRGTIFLYAGPLEDCAEYAKTGLDFLSALDIGAQDNIETKKPVGLWN
jgi:hypothetical protein